MGRKNRRKRSAYMRKMKTNPKALISKPANTRHDMMPDTISDAISDTGGGEGRQPEDNKLHDGACGNAHTAYTIHADYTEAGRIPARGDIWYVELGEHPGTNVQNGCRPAFIMSNDNANARSGTVTVVPLTSRMKKPYMPTHVLIPASEHIRLGRSMLLAEQLTTVSKSALKNYVGSLDGQRIRQIENAVKFHLGCRI